MTAAQAPEEKREKVREGLDHECGDIKTVAPTTGAANKR
jgi:hypothetical protein